MLALAPFPSYVGLTLAIKRLRAREQVTPSPSLSLKNRVFWYSDWHMLPAAEKQNCVFWNASPRTPVHYKEVIMWSLGLEWRLLRLSCWSLSRRQQGESFRDRAFSIRVNTRTRNRPGPAKGDGTGDWGCDMVEVSLAIGLCKGTGYRIQVLRGSQSRGKEVWSFFLSAAV